MRNVIYSKTKEFKSGSEGKIYFSSSWSAFAVQQVGMALSWLKMANGSRQAAVEVPPALQIHV